MIQEPQPYLKMYIAVLDEVPDFMVPTLVAHSVLGAHLQMEAITKDLTLGGQTKCYDLVYKKWLTESFRKCVIRVNQKEFDKISQIPKTYLGHENKTLNGEKSCAVVYPVWSNDLPNVLKFAKLWKPICQN